MVVKSIIITTFIIIIIIIIIDWNEIVFNSNIAFDFMIFFQIKITSF